MTRWLHPPELERQRERDRFDPVVEGARHGLARELSLAIWERVCADAPDGFGRRDTAQAQQRFHEIAARIAARGGRLRPDVGRFTRAGTELDGTPLGAWSVDELAPRTPGRETLVAAEARRWAATSDEPASVHEDTEAADGSERDGGATARPELPHAGEVAQALASLQRPSPSDQASAVTMAVHGQVRRPLDLRVWAPPGREPVYHDALSTAAPRLSERESPRSTPDDSLEVRPVVAALREQLVAAANTGRGAAEALATADPAIAVAALRELRSERAAPHTVPVLRLVAQAAGGEVERMLGRGSAGAALPGDLAERFGPHVGAEAAGAARVHTDHAADLVAAAHHAHAVTLGEDIYFARGEYAPGTMRGDELLAHELTHVAQGQRGELARAAAKGIDSGGTLDPAEAEADLRAKFAVIQLHAPEGTAPPLAAPSGQPTSDGDRQAKLAAQQQRMSLANQAAAPLTIPPAPPATNPQSPVPHPAPPLGKPPAPAPTGNAYVDTFQAPPSKQATELWAKAGTQATTQATADQAKFDAGLPPMPVVLDGGEGKGGKGGAAAGGRVPAKPPAAGAAPPAARPTPTPPAPPVSFGAALAKSIQPTADKAQLKADGQKLIDGLPTTAPDVKTDPGPAPVTDLAGQADPVRTVGDQQHAVTEGAKALDDAKAQVLSGPGAAAVQPAKLDEKLHVPKEQATGAMPALPTVDGMAKLKKWNLPGNALASFDEVAKPKMDASLAQAKAKMTEVEHKRDADRSKAVTDAQDKVKQAHADADKQQQAKVAQARTQITNHQADTLVKHENEIKKLDQQSGDKKKGTIGKINARVQADQAKVEGDYQAAQKKAEDKKQQGEADTAKKKQEAQKKQKDEHWWDKAADEVCDGIKAVAHEIDQALEAIGKAIGEILDAVKNAACHLIDAARDFVCQALTEFGDWLKTAVTALIGSVFPELAAELNRLIDAAVNVAKAAVNAVADGLKKAVTALCDGLKGALDAVIATFRAAVQAAATLAQAVVTGDWKLVAKMVLEGILKALGIDPAAFYALIGKAEDSIEKIIDNPGAFVGHLIDAVKLGFKQFGAHFWTHLKDGLVQWLFGTFASAGIHMPASFDVAGIFDLVAQVLGLTWTRLRGKVVKVIGEKNTERLEFVSQHIQSLLSGGFSGLWEHIKQDMSGLWDMVVGGVKQWIIEKVVQQAIIKIATMWNPAGAIIQLIETAWNVYQWVSENAQRIFGLVQAVVDSISNIAAGNIGGAANFIEASLAKLVPVAISLFADLIGLGGIADKIKGIIEKVQTKVDQAIDKLIARVLKLFKGKRVGKADDDKPDERTPEQKQADLDKAVEEAKALGEQKDLTETKLNAELEKIKTKYRLSELKAKAEGPGGEFQVHAAVNPECTFELVCEAEAAKKIAEAAGPRIERFTRKNTFDDVKRVLDEARQEVLPNDKNSYLRYSAPGSEGELSVTLVQRGREILIGSIWDRASLYEEVQREGNQILFHSKATGKAYVHDKKGQYVQRKIIRNISDADHKQLEANGTIRPTGPNADVSPLEHVMGEKPSQYISATKKSDGQIKNPQGETFNTGGQIEIDLLYVDPENILDLTTWTGQQEWGLSHPTGDAAQQALRDVIRTQEVLIDGWSGGAKSGKGKSTVPAKAIRRL